MGRMEYGFCPGAAFSDGELFPEKYSWIVCYAVRGGSEGHYLHLDVICHGSVKLIALAKTFEGLRFSFDVAYKITECIE